MRERPITACGGSPKLGGAALTDRLSTSAVAELWRGRSPQGKALAVKIARPGQVWPIRREAACLARIRHPAVVPLHSCATTHCGRAALVMPLLPGPSLAVRLQAGALSEAEAVGLARRLLAALAAIEAGGLVHRDVAPNNIVLVDGRADRAVLVDFGLACRAPTRAGRRFCGRLAFAAPEQLGLFGGRIDGRADRYALGLVLARASGLSVPMGDTPDCARQHRQAMPCLRGAPATLRPLLAAVLAPDPDQRPARASDALALLPTQER
ncbi:MAG: protein kinase [Rhodothalassiaceae bacterium]